MLSFRKRLIDLKKLNKEINRCSKCQGLHHLPESPWAVGSGDLDAKLFIVGQCLHAYNERTNPQIPFVGNVPSRDSGKILFAAIEKARLKPLHGNDVFITNVVHCHCPGHRSPVHEEILNCSDFLQKEIMLVKPKAFLLLGSLAKKKFCYTKAINSFAIQESNKIFAAHPSYIMRYATSKMKEKYINLLSTLIQKVLEEFS
jgi:DNA polymerase